MKNKIHSAFEPIKAPDSMKKSTIEYLQKQRITQSPKPARRPFKRGFVAICTLLILFMGLGIYTVKTPVSYVSIDVNPSLELALNRYDKVVSVKAYNEDGNIILDGLKVNGIHYKKAIDIIVQSKAMKPYLTEDSALTFTVASGQKKKEDEILKGIKSCKGCSENKATECSADISTLEKAHGYGMSFGKYSAYLTLSQYDDSISTEECKNMTMSEIRRKINSYKSKGEHGNNESHNNGGSESSGGSGFSNHNGNPSGGQNRHGK